MSNRHCADRRHGWLAIAAVLGVTAALLAATTASAKTGGSSAAATFTYADSTQIVGAELDPAYSGSEEAIALINVYDGFVRYDARTQKPKPELAVSWKSNAAKTKWTFKLRSGVKFHTGRAFDAQAAKQSLERSFKSKGYGSYIWGTCTKVSAPAKLTLVIACQKPTALDFNATSWYGAYILDTKASGSQDLRKWLDAGHDAGTGPYTIDQWNKGADPELRLKRFDGYWGGWSGSHYQNVVYRVVPNGQTAAQLLQSGEAQFVPRTSPEIWASFKNSSKVTAIDPPSFTNMFAMLNTKRPPLNDPQVRQAIAYGIDLSGLSKVLKGSLAPPHGILPPAMLGHFNDLPTYGFNPAKAAQLLKSKGFGPGGKNIRLELTYITGDPTETAAAQLMKADLGQVNVTLDLQPLQWPTLWARSKSKNLQKRQDIAMFQWFPDYVDPSSWFTNMFVTQNPPFFNIGYYSSPPLDKHIGQAVDAIATNRDQAARLFRQVQVQLLRDLPAIPLGDIRNQFLIAKSVKGYVYNPAYYTGVIVYDLTPA